MSNKEIYILSIVNAIFSLRILGIFTILPVLSTYGMKLIGANEASLGIAIGIYGISQILFQIPCGFASDKIGRKPIIVGGLLITSLGTTIAAILNTIEGIILGRALQGVSAINGTLIALLSDELKEKNKTKAMLTIGINFSIMFAISIIIGPIITSIVGLRGLFWSITLITLLGLILAILYIPSSQQHHKTKNKNSIIKDYKIIKLLAHPQLIKIDCSIFFLHTILMLNFIVFPKIMHTIKLLPIQQSKIYCINIFVSLLISAIAILHAEKTKKMKRLLIFSICTLLFAEIILLQVANSLHNLFLGTLFFFIAFNLIEGILPSLLIKETPVTHKGITIGIFSTSQFLGIALGGILGGYLLHLYSDIQVIFYSAILLIIIWIIITLSLKEPPYKN